MAWVEVCWALCLGFEEALCLVIVVVLWMWYMYSLSCC